MLIVKVRNNNIEQTIKIMRRKVISTKQLKKLRELKHYTKKSTQRREEKHKAIYKEIKRREEE